MKFIGIDGCKAGWFYVGFDQNQQWQIGIVDQISDFSVDLSKAYLSLIDMPIGLKNDGLEERACDIEARQKLKPKRSASVFSVPCRASLDVTDYRQASGLNFQKTGRKLSKQTWNIMPKIRQLDDFLRNEKHKPNIREMHPELCFWALNGQQAMQHTKRSEQGFLERKKLLKKYCQSTEPIVSEALRNFPKQLLAQDDVLDALVGAVTAQFHESLASLPETPQYDEIDLPMEVVYPRLHEDMAVIKTPAGFIRLDAKDHELIQVQWLSEANAEQLPSGPFLKNVVQQIKQYWQNPGSKFSVEKKHQGTDFMNQVWQALEQIPAGQTCTYGELAKKLSTSARAVGNACRKNPYPLIVPCHRVVSVSGMGGYDGETAGKKLGIKLKLLAHEQ